MEEKQEQIETEEEETESATEEKESEDKEEQTCQLVYWLNETWRIKHLQEKSNIQMFCYCALSSTICNRLTDSKVLNSNHKIFFSSSRYLCSFYNLKYLEHFKTQLKD